MNQSKTECSYTESEKSSSAWRDLDTPCSKKTRCCCAKEELQEKICLPLNTTAEFVHTTSPTSARIERYKRSNTQSYFNTESPCKLSGNVPLEHSYNFWRNITTGCCLKTVWYQAVLSGSGFVKKNVGQRGPLSTCHVIMHNSWQYYPNTCRQECVEFEEIHHCSDDGGRTPNGILYKRSPEGYCLGDQSTKQRLAHVYGHEKVERTIAGTLIGESRLEKGDCPQGWTSGDVDGEACECAEACA
jgi:hypothetical protein